MSHIASLFQEWGPSVTTTIATAISGSLGLSQALRQPLYACYPHVEKSTAFFIVEQIALGWVPSSELPDSLAREQTDVQEEGHVCDGGYF